MPARSNGEARPHDPRRGSTLLGVAILCAAAAAGGLWVGRRAAPEPETAARTISVLPSPSVITAMRDLARLEGAVYAIERIIDVREKQSRFFNLIETEDALLLVAGGVVTAGVDLAELQPDDVVVDASRRHAKIRLPRASIFSCRIDNERTYVHARRTDTWAVRQEHLEARARQEAERSLEKAALEAGILRQSEESVGRTVESLLRSLGFHTVEIHFSSAGSTEPDR